MQYSQVFLCEYGFAFVFIILFYAIGLYFFEDAVGGTRGDYMQFHKPAMDLFLTNPVFEAIKDYPSATTPFFYIFHVYINPFSSTEIGLRVSNVVITLFTGGLFFYLIKTRYHAASHLSVALLGSLFLISPYTKSIAIWPVTDNLPYLFLFSSLILLKYLEKGTTQKKYGVIMLIAFVSSLAYYTRQSYLVFSLYFFLKILQYYEWDIKTILYTLALFILSALPLLYLFIQWQGLNPPSFSHHKVFNINSLPYAFQFIAFYSTPLIVYALLKMNWQEFNKKKLLEYSSILLVYFVVFFDFYFYDKSGGVMQKLALAVFGAFPEYAITLFLLYSSIGVIFTYVLIRENFENIMVFLPLSFFITTEHIAQKYADPIVIVVLLLLLKSKISEYYMTKNLAIIQFAYSLSFYLFAVVYYNR